ncbi:MAG: cobalamin-dependent protein [Candidatus Sulfobium sp.]|jgi:hypothetical protein
MSKKVVFCFHTNDHEYNMGIGFLSSFLKKNGVESDLVVYREIPGKSIDTPESVASEIMEKGSPVVTFSVMTFNWLRIRKIISLLRQMNYNGLIVVGGYHAILTPDEVLSEPGVDAVCMGEGEKPLLELTRLFYGGSGRMLPSVRGILLKGDSPYDISDKRWHVPNQEDCPYVDYELFGSEGNEDLSKKLIGSLSPEATFPLAVIAGRACPHKCTYCSNSALIDHYVEEACTLRKHGIMIVTFNIPYETKDPIRKTFDLNAAIEPDAAIPFIYQVFPSTELARIAYEGSMVPSLPEGRWDYCTASLDTPDLPASDVVGIVQDFGERFGNRDQVEHVYSTLRQLVSY